MTVDIDIDGLADLLHRTDTMTPEEVALGIAALGILAVATAPGEKDPLLRAEHVNSCAKCQAAGLRPTRDHGATTDEVVIRRLWSVHPDAGVGMKNHPRIVRGDGDFRDGAELRKARKVIGYGQPSGVPNPCEAPTPGGQYRRRYIHFLPEGVTPPGGGTKASGVAWYGDSGYTVIKGRHPNGQTYQPFHGTITELPEQVAIQFRYRQTGSTAAETATSDEQAVFLAEHVGTSRLDRLAERRRTLANTAEGDRHHQAVVELTCAFREAIAGWYPANLAHDTIRSALVEAGWDQSRFDGEWTQIAAWALGQVKHLTAVEATEEIERHRDEVIAKSLELAYSDEFIDAIEAEIGREFTDAELDAIDAEQHGPTGGAAGPDDDDMKSFHPIDLGPAWRGEKPRTEAEVFKRDDGIALLLPGINYLFGDSGDGKSMVAQVATADELHAGHPVIWITYEDANEDLMVDRLRLLGATADDVSRLLFITPQLGLTMGAETLAALAITSGSRLLVLDSVGEAMAAGGVNEDRDNEVGPWFRKTLRLIHDRLPSLTILPIDHSTKSKESPLFPSGSKRKRSAPTGRVYLLNVGKKGFGVGAVGYVQLVVAKDRGGTFARGAIAADIMLDATTIPYTWQVRAPRAGDTYTAKEKRRNAVDRVLEVLAGSAVELNAGEVQRLVNGSDVRRPEESEISIKTVKNTPTELAKRPGVSMSKAAPDGNGRYTPPKWLMTCPDRDESAA